VQQNCLRSLEGLEQLPHLNTLNVSSNGLSSLVELPCCPQLATLLADRNHLSTLEALEPLLHCPSLHTLDLQNNSIEDPAVIDAVIARLPQLHCLYLAGNPVVSKVPSYRKSLIARCRELTYLDDRPITDEERQLCAAW
jgi:dynein assembly factor 1